MIYNAEELEELLKDPILGIVKACEHAMELGMDISQPEGWNEGEQNLYIEIAGLVSILIEKAGVVSVTDMPQVTGEVGHNAENFFNYVRAVLQEFKANTVLSSSEAILNKYRSVMNLSFEYEFSSGDLERIQILINELRQYLTETDQFKNEHQQRLLKRLEKLQSELHKKVSDLDQIWGFIGEAGIVLGKFGTDAKPIVDRIQEIVHIAWKTQARAEELSSDAINPMLGFDGHEEDGDN